MYVGCVKFHLFLSAYKIDKQKTNLLIILLKLQNDPQPIN